MSMFELDSANAVKENIVFPIKEGFGKENFGYEFSVSTYPFAKYKWSVIIAQAEWESK